jgi:multiple sugar transport system substrate-binding protein
MRKPIVLCASLVLVLGLVLTGCGLFKAPEPTLVPVDRVQIHWFLWTSEEKQEIAHRYVEAFNESQDDIELVLDAIHPSQRDAALAEMLESGEFPDIIGPTGWGLDAMQYFDLIADQRYILMDRLTDVDPDILDMWQVEGKLLGVPFGVLPSAIIYNADLFDAAGLPYPPSAYGEPYADGDDWTIEKMEDVALQLTLDGDGDNATSRSSFDPEGIVQWGFHWQWVSGTGWVNMFGAGMPLDGDYNARVPDHWREAYEWYYSGMWDEHFMPTGAFGDRPLFEDGKIAMMQQDLWYLPTLQDVPFNWNIAAVPSYKGETTVRWGAEGFLVLASSDHPQEASETAYMLAAAPELAAAWGSVPAFGSLQEDFFVNIDEEYPGINVEAIGGSLDHLSFPPHSGMMPNYNEAIGRLEYFRDMLATTPDLDLDVQIDQLELDLQAIFDEADSP